MKYINLKNLFYQGYYQGIDFRKGMGNKEAIEDYNANIFRRRNQKMVQYPPHERYLQLLDLEERALPHYQAITLETIYPGLLIGSGNVHETNTKEELKLGFFFDHTTGLPMVPGSSVKGVLRNAFPNFEPQSDLGHLPKTEVAGAPKVQLIQAFCSTLQTKAGDELAALVHQLEYALFAGYDIPKTIADKKVVYQSSQHRCRFLDAIIDTPAPNGRIVGTDALTPHGTNPLKNPKPLPFLKILPQVKIKFQFQLLPVTLQEGLQIEVSEIKALLQHILLTYGVGAKTNVGYGQFTTLPEQKVFEKKQEISGKLINKVYDQENKNNPYKLLFSIEGNPTQPVATVNDKIFDKYEIGEEMDLIVTSVTDKGAIKYVKIAK